MVIVLTRKNERNIVTSMEKLAFKYIVRRIFVGAVVIFLLVYIPINWHRIPVWLDAHTFKEGLRTLDGRPVSNIEDITDEDVIVIVFWSTKCKYCHRQLTELSELANNVVAINVRDSQASVEKYVRENRIKFTVLLGAPQPPGQGLPHTQLLAKIEGRWQLIDEWMGVVSANQIMEYLE